MGAGFNIQVEKAFRRLANFYQCDLPSKELSAKLLSELNIALHELQTTVEELAAKNEEMAYNRSILDEEKHRYQDLFDFAPNAYLVTDTEGIILEDNISATKLFNVSRPFLINSPLAVFVHHEDRLSFHTRLTEIEAKTVIENENWELVLLSGQRTAFPASITMRKVISPRGGPPRLRWLLHDITEQKQLEAEQQKADKLESLGLLAGGIAHDLNNLLTIILGNLTLMKMHIEKEHKAYNYLQEMDDAICQTRDLTLQLLTFAKGGKPLTRAVSISRLIEETASFALSGSKSKYELILEKELPAVEIDQGQITQVITNLLINADQAMPEGGRIEIRAENHAVQQGNTLLLQPGDYIVLTITDEGPGISNQNLIKIFDPYFTTKESGNGLGLTICYSIIKKHAGHISVHSAQGKGTTFTVYLPVSAKQAKQEEIPEDVLILGNERVLLMDDETSVQKTACEMLTFLGYEVESAADGSEAIRLYEEAFQSGYAFDVVIFDLTVRGGMGGKAAIAELLKINPDVKAIVSSGYSSDMLADYKKYGFCDVIAKPYRLQEMGNVLSNVLQGIKTTDCTEYKCLSENDTNQA